MDAGGHPDPGAGKMAGIDIQQPISGGSGRPTDIRENATAWWS